MIKLIGLSGLARSGKDTTGRFLSELIGCPTYALASPIKQACNELFGWDSRHSDGELKEVADPFWGVSPRYAYQTLGTEWGRNLIRDDIWLKRAEMMLDKHGSLIVTDVRFENEAKWIRDMGGKLIHVKREGIESVLKHASENGVAIQPEDVVLYNNWSIEQLKDNCKDLVKLLAEGAIK